MMTRRFPVWCLCCLPLLLHAGGVAAQIDLAGYWAVESHQDRLKEGRGPLPADWSGIPLNAEGRAAGLSFAADSLEELQRQCHPWPVTYIVTGGFGFRIWSTTDHYGVANAWHIDGSLDRMPMTIWIDGRKPPPPDALHTYSGFTTGHWEGDTLVTETTLIKDSLLERNGAPNSNQETFRMFITRHNDELTITGIVRDPVYLEAPMVLAQTWRLSPAGSPNSQLDLCNPSETIEGLSDGYHFLTVLPGRNSSENFMAQHYNVPLDASHGGARTMYPEFRQQLMKDGYRPPSNYCTMNCCMGDVFGGGPKAVCDVHVF